MKILVYIGYQHQPLTQSDVNASVKVGGSELAAVKLAESLQYRGYDVYIGGQVVEGVWNGVKWITIEYCQREYFDLVIAVNYLHYLKKLPTSFSKSIFWFHNTDFFKWYVGEQSIDESWLQDDRLTAVVGLTKWHANQLQRGFNLTKPLHIIGNGLDRKDFPAWKVGKIPASFIYSSARERGLYRLLDMWPKIKQQIPEATLRVFGPGYDRDNTSLPNLPGVTYMGTVDQQTLHNWQMKSEYWLHPTEYKETYCITALEAQYAGCIPITTSLAALREVVSSRGFLFNQNETDESLINIIKVLHRSPEVKEKLRSRMQHWAKQQTWSSRTDEWIKLINQL